MKWRDMFFKNAGHHEVLWKWIKLKKLFNRDVDYLSKYFQKNLLIQFHRSVCKIERKLEFVISTKHVSDNFNTINYSEETKFYYQKTPNLITEQATFSKFGKICSGYKVSLRNNTNFTWQLISFYTSVHTTLVQVRQLAIHWLR